LSKEPFSLFAFCRSAKRVGGGFEGEGFRRKQRITINLK
jgi:hypothetical protein